MRDSEEEDRPRTASEPQQTKVNRLSTTLTGHCTHAVKPAAQAETDDETSRKRNVPMRNINFQVFNGDLLS